MLPVGKHTKGKVSPSHLAIPLKTLTFQTLQRLPIALAEVNESIISKNVLNKVRQIIYSLYQTIEVTKKCKQYNKFNKVIIQNG